jgi:GNAT superfamily N-acetyltransferase
VDEQPEIVDHDDPAFAPVLAALTVEYARRYGQHDATTDASTADFAPPDGALLIIRVDGRTVSAGGFRRVDGATCELKRMWTAADQRRRGHARRILAALENIAAARGYRAIRLETGPAQPEAITLYQSAGYLPDPQNVRHAGATAFVKQLHGENVAG